MRLKILYVFILGFVFIAASPLFAGNCEIIKADYFTREQEAIVTDWNAGIPYKRYTIEIYPCAHMTFRNTFWQSLYSTDIEVTGKFTDQSTKTKQIACDKKLLAPNEEFSCSLCFESNSQISGLECRFK